MKKLFLKIVSILLVVAICASTFSACGSSESTPASTPDQVPISAPDESAATPIEPLVEEDPVVEGLSQEQRASMEMMNYLAYVVEIINRSPRSRLTLDTVFDELESNVEKSIIDDATLEAFESVFKTISKYEANRVAFDRLEFLSGQDNALTILTAINPLEVMDLLAEKGPVRTLASLALSTVNTVAETSYTSAEELAYLERTWSLEDAEMQALLQSRIDLFKYMVEKAQDLPTGITLTKNDIEEYVKTITEKSGKSKLGWLEDHQETYQYFGYYWLDLADSYYECKDYAKCLSAIEAYRSRNTGIFKTDKRLAESMVYALDSAKEMLTGAAYESAVADYADTIVNNIGPNDWELRFNATMAYLELYEQSKEIDYLNKAYIATRTNVENLVQKQRDQNKEYINDIKEAEASSNANKEENSIIKAYNKYIKDRRKTELPPVYEPLRLNCEWLFLIAEKLNISSDEKDRINSLLHDGSDAFLNYELNKKFTFGDVLDPPASLKGSVSYAGVLADQKLTIPVVLAWAGTTIKGELINGGEKIALEEWVVNEVDRNKSSNVYDFEAVYTCKAPKPIVFRTGDTITLDLTPPGGNEEEVITIKIVVDKLIVGVPHFKVDSIVPIE